MEYDGGGHVERYSRLQRRELSDRVSRTADRPGVGCIWRALRAVECRGREWRSGKHLLFFFDDGRCELVVASECVWWGGRRALLPCDRSRRGRGCPHRVGGCAGNRARASHSTSVEDLLP